MSENIETGARLSTVGLFTYLGIDCKGKFRRRVAIICCLAEFCTELAGCPNRREARYLNTLVVSSLLFLVDLAAVNNLQL
jgi:hypothetical protein